MRRAARRSSRRSAVRGRRRWWSGPAGPSASPWTASSSTACWSRPTLYRAFKLSRASGRAFQFLRDATPEQAAAALRGLPPQPEPPPPHRRVRWWIELALALSATAAVVASLARPELIPEQAVPMLAGLFLMEMTWRHFAGPMLAAVRRGLRPTWGAMLGGLLFAYAVWLFATSAARLWRAG